MGYDLYPTILGIPILPLTNKKGKIGKRKNS